MYRNQLSEEAAKAAGHEYPAVLARVGNDTVKLLGKAEIDACDGDLDKVQRTARLTSGSLRRLNRHSSGLDVL